MARDTLCVYEHYGSVMMTFAEQEARWHQLFLQGTNTHDYVFIETSWTPGLFDDQDEGMFAKSED